MTKKQIDWLNMLFLPFAHLMALGGLVWMVFFHFSWGTLVLAAVMTVFSGVSVTGGYHRLFAHPTYKAAWPLRAFYLFFGAAAVQNSALRWSADHRVHHKFTDTDADPYNIKRGFWWAHIGWVLFKNPLRADLSKVPDLQADALVRFQHKYYLPLVVFSLGLLPAGLGLLWGDPVGAVLVAGFFRVVFQWHATFSVNSFAHYIGNQPYSDEISARDSFITAILSMGEGYHNFHHRFQADYRNGVRWYQFDPTKWWVWTLSKVKLTSDLRRTPKRAIEAARQANKARLAKTQTA
ncbi:MAG TPA: fatty acid desaturase [Planctomycetota bacterium]